METKRQHAIRHLRRPALPTIQIFYEFQQLKTLYRQGWRRVGIPREQCETVAEHTLGVALLALFLADEYFPQLDRHKLLRMALLHDFGEIYAGDIVPGRMSLAEKHRREQRAIRRVFRRLPQRAAYQQIWEEFEAGQSAEARLLRELDRLEMGLQALVYEQEGWGPLDNFFASAERALTSPVLRRILAAATRLRPRPIPPTQKKSRGLRRRKSSTGVRTSL